MRYWALLAGKIIASLAISCLLLFGLVTVWPAGEEFSFVYVPRFGSDLLFTAAVGIWFLITVGLLYLCIWDQRYRCRVCLRRLRMPIEIGSWHRMLQSGRPEIEYICTYGHGRLNVAEVQISGSENPEWTPHQNDIWTELTQAGGKDDRPK